MSDLIDKKALLKELKAIRLEADGHWPDREHLAEQMIGRIANGEFDAKPEPTTRTLPSYPGSVRVREYNMCDPESRFAYLLDITDELLSYRNTHFEKEHIKDKERLVWLVESVEFLLKRMSNHDHPSPEKLTTIEKRVEQIEKEQADQKEAYPLTKVEIIGTGKFLITPMVGKT
jgi:hypothetical protein